MPRLAYASTKSSDMRYLVRVEIPDPFFLLDTGDRTIIFLDHREFGVFQEQNENPAIELVLVNPLMEAAREISGDGPAAGKLALHILRTYGVLGDAIGVPTSFPLNVADFLRAQGARLTPTHPFVPQRLRKTNEEVAAIRESLRRTHEAFRIIETMLREAAIVGDAVEYRGALLTSEMLKRAAEEALFARDLFNVEGIIVSCGPHAAIPHHPGHGPIRAGETIVCDIFPRHRASGYFADMTRTYVKGSPSSEIVRMYDAVRTAQERAIAAVRPGAIGRGVHAVSCVTFRELGYDIGDRGFTHGTGHGLGLDVHEEPFLNATATTALEPGHVVTVEPGLYYPERGGIRIEDVVVVTDNGCENLTEYQKEFVIP
ncbi:aminopeptidase P family protein [Candidatus Uhrbacteria bacterium]|nr:aminopeptidase P family protein [Candidatus Uhrbacteria bacterium]